MPRFSPPLTHSLTTQPAKPRTTKNRGSLPASAARTCEGRSLPSGTRKPRLTMVSVVQVAVVRMPVLEEADHYAETLSRRQATVKPAERWGCDSRE
jgi:hypothetical protein